MTEELLYFYYREGCHLCEEMAAHLFREWPAVAHAMQWRDVDERDGWREQFGSRVPLLTLGTEVLSEYRVDPERLAAHFSARSNPV